MSKMADFTEEDLGQIRNRRREGGSWVRDAVERIVWEGEGDAIFGLVEHRGTTLRGHRVQNIKYLDY